MSPRVTVCGKVNFREEGSRSESECEMRDTVARRRPEAQ